MVNNSDIFCAFGDSITAGGLWVAEVFDYVKQFGTKVYNCGVAGDTAYDSLRRIDYDCISHNPTIVTVMFGVNDIEHWLDPDNLDLDYCNSLISRHKECLDTVIKTFLDRKIKVILLSPPPYLEGDYYSTADFKCNDRVEKCADFARDLAKNTKCDFIDIYSIFNSLPNMFEYFKEDRVHPNAFGQRVIAKAVLQKLGYNYETNCKEEFDFSSLNRERMKVESSYREIMYAMHDTVEKYADRMGISYTEEEKLEKIKQETNSPYMYVSYCAKKYLENINDLANIKEKISEYTEKMALAPTSASGKERS